MSLYDTKPFLYNISCAELMQSQRLQNISNGEHSTILDLK